MTHQWKAPASSQRWQLPGWGWWRAAREALPPVFSFYQSAHEYLSPSPCPPLPVWTPPRTLLPSRTLLTWQWAGTGQEVALNSCHNGRALGCGGSEPRPERQGRWHGGGRRQVRM